MIWRPLILWVTVVGTLKAEIAAIDEDLPEIPRRPDEKATRVPISDKGVMDIYQKWVDTGMSSLLSAVANKRLKRNRREIITKFGECSSVADSVPKHAKCVSKLLRNEIRLHPEDLKRQEQRITRYGRKDPKGWTGAFKMRSKRSPSISSVHSYDLHSSKPFISPFGGIAKFLMESVLAQKNKTHDQVIPWQKTVSKLRDNGAKKRKIRKDLEEDSEESADQLAFRGLKKHLLKQERGDIEADELFDDPKKIKDFLTKSSKKKNKKPLEKILQLVRDGVKLGYTLTGQNSSDMENQTMRLISPRFLGVVPEEKQSNDLDFLSPSLFSLHDQGTGIENLTSLPNLLRGASVRDQQHWLDLIMEAAGVNEESEKLEREVLEIEQNKTKHIFEPEKMVDDDGVPLYFTKENATKIGGDFEKRKVETFENLQRTYSKDQLREMNTTGYALLRDDQLHLLYGSHSPYNNSKALGTFRNLSDDQMHDFIERDIHRLSELEKFKIREKDVVLSPILFTNLIAVPGTASQPLILSPILFSPLILSPSVFGAVILSPWMFVPLALSPRVLGALILSPFIFSPIILTPLALHPAILSPGVFNPLILSPVALVPLILSPQVFTPIILNPLVLSPLILNPMVGSPLILSPYALSPIIASPMALSALILSPYALSPVVFSPLIAFAAILSPSWLS